MDKSVERKINQIKAEERIVRCLSVSQYAHSAGITLDAFCDHAKVMVGDYMTFNGGMSAKDAVDTFLRELRCTNQNMLDAIAGNTVYMTGVVARLLETKIALNNMIRQNASYDDSCE